MFFIRKVMLVLCLGLPLAGWSQTGIIRGVLLDDKSVPLTDETVLLRGTNNQAVTDKDGKFAIENVAYGTYMLTVQDVAYSGFSKEIKVSEAETDLGEIKLTYTPGAQTNEADIPVVTLDEDEVQSSSAQASVSSVLGAARDAFQSAANFNFSIARFKTRGYESENFPTLMNGIAEEDLTNGRTAYSSWSGLNDVLRSRESTSGLNPANYAFGGVGGSYAIDSRASRQRKQIQATYSLTNRTYNNRLMLTYGSGFNKKGWAFAASISKRWAKEGYIKGTYYDGFAYYLGVSKLIDRHEIDFTILGSQSESARSSTNTQEVYDITGDHYYNSNWGYQNGKIRNANIGRNHQPVFILNHEYKVNNSTSWFTSMSFTTGKRESTALNWFAADPRPTYYRNLPSWQTDSTLATAVYNTLKENPSLLQLNWDNMILGNSENIQTVTNANGIAGETVTGKQALYLIENRIIQTNRFSVSTNMNTIVNDNVTISSGLSYQKQTSRYYKEAEDLLGADFFVDIDKFADQDFQDEQLSQSDLNNPNRIVKEGDRFGYDYEAHITHAEAWSQAVAKYSRIDLFGAIKAAYTSVYRQGNYRNGLFPDDSYGKSKTYVFPDIGIKGGITYKINGRNYVFANAGYMTQAPFFNNMYLSPRSRSTVVANPTSEKISSVEGGYLFTAPKVKGKLKLYYTNFKDGTETRSYYLQGFGTNSYVNYTMSDIEKVHTGTEISVDANLGMGFSAIAVAAIGQYYYSSRPNATITVDNTNTVQSSGNVIYMKNLHVDNTPQNAYSFGINYRSKKFWYVNLNANYFTNMYVDVTPARRTADVIDGLDENSQVREQILSQQRYDNQFTLDLNGGWSMKLNNKIKALKRNSFLLLNVSINNLLDNKDIINYGYEQGRIDKAALLTRGVDVFAPKYSYAFGRTYMLNIILRFN